MMTPETKNYLTFSVFCTQKIFMCNQCSRQVLLYVLFKLVKCSKGFVCLTVTRWIQNEHTVSDLSLLMCCFSWDDCKFQLTRVLLQTVAWNVISATNLWLPALISTRISCPKLNLVVNKDDLVKVMLCVY